MYSNLPPERQNRELTLQTGVWCWYAIDADIHWFFHLDVEEATCTCNYWPWTTTKLIRMVVRIALKVLGDPQGEGSWRRSWTTTWRSKWRLNFHSPHMCSVIAIILDAFLFSSGTEHLPQSDQALISGLPKRPKADAYRDGNDNVVYVYVTFTVNSKHTQSRTNLLAK